MPSTSDPRRPDLPLYDALRERRSDNLLLLHPSVRPDIAQELHKTITEIEMKRGLIRPKL